MSFWDIDITGERNISCEAPCKPNNSDSTIKYTDRDESKENRYFSKSKNSAVVNSDSKWNFWNTLKNPLQWIGLTNEQSRSKSI